MKAKMKCDEDEMTSAVRWQVVKAHDHDFRENSDCEQQDKAFVCFSGTLFFHVFCRCSHEPQRVLYSCGRRRASSLSRLMACSVRRLLRFP